MFFYFSSGPTPYKGQSTHTNWLYCFASQYGTLSVPGLSFIGMCPALKIKVDQQVNIKHVPCTLERESLKIKYLSFFQLLKMKSFLTGFTGGSRAVRRMVQMPYSAIAAVIKWFGIWPKFQVVFNDHFFSVRTCYQKGGKPWGTSVCIVCRLCGY